MLLFSPLFFVLLLCVLNKDLISLVNGQAVCMSSNDGSSQLYGFNNNGLAFYHEGEWIAYTENSVLNNLACTNTTLDISWSTTTASVAISHNSGKTWVTSSVRANFATISKTGKNVVTLASASTWSPAYSYYSTDYGLSWSETALDMEAIYGMAADASGKYVFYTNSLGEIKGSIDYGISFPYTLDSGLDFRNIACDGSANTIVVVVTEGSLNYLYLYQNWTINGFNENITAIVLDPFEITGSNEIANISALAVSSSSNPVVIVFANYYGSVFVSQDEGNSWVVTSFPAEYSWNNIVLSDSGQVQSLTFHTTSVNTLNLFMSWDYGTTFTKQALSEPDSCIAGFGFNFQTKGVYSMPIVEDACNLCFDSRDNEAYKYYNDGTFATCQTCKHYPVYVNNNFDYPAQFKDFNRRCIRACPYPYIPSNTITWTGGNNDVECSSVWLEASGALSLTLALLIAFLYIVVCLWAHFEYNASKNLLRRPSSFWDLIKIIREMDYSLLRQFVLLTGIPFLDSISDMLYVLNAEFYNVELFICAMFFFLLCPVLLLSWNMWRSGARASFRLWALPEWVFGLVNNDVRTIFHVLVVTILCLPQLVVNGVFLVPWFCFGVFLHMTRTITLGLLYNTWYSIWTNSDRIHKDEIFLVEHYNEEFYAGILMEALPQLLIQIVNTSSMKQWTVISKVSITFSATMVLNGAYQIVYYKMIRGTNLRDVERGISGKIVSDSNVASSSTLPMGTVVTVSNPLSSQAYPAPAVTSHRDDDFIEGRITNVEVTIESGTPTSSAEEKSSIELIDHSLSPSASSSTVPTSVQQYVQQQLQEMKTYLDSVVSGRTMDNISYQRLEAESKSYTDRQVDALKSYWSNQEETWKAYIDNRIQSSSTTTHS